VLLLSNLSFAVFFSKHLFIILDHVLLCCLYFSFAFLLLHDEL